MDFNGPILSEVNGDYMPRDIIDTSPKLVEPFTKQSSQSSSEPAEPFKLKGFNVRPSNEIPRRRWLYGDAYLGGTVTGTIAPGGAGKSVLTLAEAIAIAAMPSEGQQTHSLLGKWTKRGLRVAYLNLEDDADEQERRAAAVIETYELDAGALHERLLRADSASFGLSLIEMNGGQAVLQPDIEKLEATIKANSIDVLIVDPFVSIHSVSENDNGAIDKAIKALGRVARSTGACIHLVHHVAKLRGDSLSQDSARGASAFVDGLRALRGVVKMTQSEAEGAGLQSPDGYIRAESMKANYAKPEKGDWYYLKSHTLGNGESVGVPVPWKYPDAMDAFSASDVRAIMLAVQATEHVRADPQTHGEWIGTVIGEIMGWDVPDGSTKKDKHTTKQALNLAAVKRAISAWTASGLLIASKIQNPDRSNRKAKVYTVDPERIPDATT